MTPPPGRSEPSEQMEAIASRAADKAVRDAMFLIGIDVGDRDALDEIQADRAFVRRQRRASDARGLSLSTGIIVVLFSALSTVVGTWALGILKLGGHP